MVNAIQRASLLMVIGLAVVIGSIMIALAGEPIIVISSPSDSETVYSDTITVSGTALGTEFAVVESVTVNGVLASGTTSWSAVISLQAGSNTITVVATDNAGSTATKIITVFYIEPTPTPTPTPSVPPSEGGGGRAPPAPTPTPTLTPTPTPVPTGSISITTSPSGAEVYLDESYKGITPISLDNVTGGSYTIKIIKEGYINETKAISLGAGETINLDIPLEPLTGSINVSSIPSGASMYLDGDDKGETPLLLSEVVVGSHSVKLTKSGYGDITKTVSVSVGETTYVRETLTGYGSLEVSTDPSGASVHLDGDYRGETPLSISKIVEGSHSIKLTKSGYDDVTKKVSVSIGETTYVQEFLTGYGSLSISSDPSGASVFLDGDYKGKTPLSISKVVAGSHSIKLTKFGYADVRKTIQLSAVKTTHVSETLPFTSWLNVIGVVCSIIIATGALITIREIFKKKRAPETPPVKPEQKPTLKKEVAIPLSESITIERTIYDPCKRDFIISTKRAFPNVKNWIERNDPSMYWLIVCINNNLNKSIDRWDVKIDLPSVLKILNARIEGVEHILEAQTEPSPEIGNIRYIFSVPSQLRTTIPSNGSSRMYFKIIADADACGITYSIKGKVSTPDGEIPIEEKQFKYSCDVNTLDNAIVTNPKGATDLVSSVIRSHYTGKEAIRIIDSFETIIAISNADDKTRADDLKSKLKQLRSLLFEEPLLNKIDEFYRRTEQELFDSGYLDSNYAWRTKRFCEEFIKDWKGEFLR